MLSHLLSVVSYSPHQHHLDYDMMAPRNLIRRPLRGNTPLHLTSLGCLLAACSGHGDYTAYHEWFNHPDALLTCSCGQPKAPQHFFQHFFHCLLGKQAAPHPWRGQPAREVLGTSKGTLCFHQWLQQSSFYVKICPAHSATATPLAAQGSANHSLSINWPGLGM